MTLATPAGALEHVPRDLEAALVVVVHLVPDDESYLAGLLQRHTSCPVTQVEQDVEVQAWPVIKRFTRELHELFDGVASDVGHPVPHVTHKLGSTDVAHVAAGVFHRLIPEEALVASEEGRTYRMYMAPLALLGRPNRCARPPFPAAP